MPLLQGVGNITLQGISDLIQRFLVLFAFMWMNNRSKQENTCI